MEPTDVRIVGDTTRPDVSYVSLPSGGQLRVVREVTYGDVLVSTLLVLVLVVYAGGRLFDQVRRVI